MLRNIWSATEGIPRLQKELELYENDTFDRKCKQILPHSNHPAGRQSIPEIL